MAARTRTAKATPKTAEDWQQDAAVVADTPGATPAPVRPRLRAVPTTGKSPGQIAFERLARQVKARIAGKPVKDLPDPDEAEPVENWQLDSEPQRRVPDQSLAGLYRIIHGNISMGGGRYALTGRNVRLAAVDAEMFIERQLVERIGD